jgi:hypothetical protein
LMELTMKMEQDSALLSATASVATRNRGIIHSHYCEESCAFSAKHNEGPPTKN